MSLWPQAAQLLVAFGGAAYPPAQMRSGSPGPLRRHPPSGDRGNLQFRPPRKAVRIAVSSPLEPGLLPLPGFFRLLCNLREPHSRLASHPARMLLL
jgi:hypothetical protein